jgi:hypothetical protein
MSIKFLNLSFWSTRKIKSLSSEKTDYIPFCVDRREDLGVFVCKTQNIPFVEMRIILEAIDIPEVSNITISDQHGHRYHISEIE